MPELSIIVTAYNVDKFIGPCLDGVTGQTLEDIEIIVVDDGSSDGTAEIISDYAAKDPRIKSIRFDQNTPGGVASAANAGIDAATGDFIGFADGDDLYDPQMFGKLYDAAIAHDADLAMCQYHLLDEATGELFDPADARHWLRYPEAGVLSLDAAQRSDLLRFIAVPWRKIYRRDLVERVGLRFPEGDYFFEDNPVHWAAILGAERLAMVPEILCQHRVSRPGQTMETADHRLPQIFQHHDTIRDHLRRIGLEDVHGTDLLLWLSYQLAWVSARAKGEVQRTLFDVLQPIIAQYGAERINGFCGSIAPFGTGPMLLALQANDFAGFVRASDNLTKLNAPGKGAKGKSGGTSLWALGIYHLKQSGVRRTARLTARFISERLGRRVRMARGKEMGNVTQKDLMMGIVLLQREVRKLRAEVQDLRQELQDAREDTDQNKGQDSPN